MPEPAHPHINEALESMRAAKHHLEGGEHDFNGHRAKAIEHLNQAIREAEICMEMKVGLVSNKNQKGSATWALPFSLQFLDTILATSLSDRSSDSPNRSRTKLGIVVHEVEVSFRPE